MNMEAPRDVRAAFEDAERFPPVWEYPPEDGGDPGPPPPPEEEIPIEARCVFFALNDYGNGQRFLAHFGEDCLFAPRVGWHRWTGKVWRLDEDRLDVRALAQRIGEKIVEEVPFVALEDWEREAIEAEESAAEELAALVAKDDPDRAEKKRIRALGEIVDAGREARKALGARKRSHRSHGKSSGNTGPINNMLTEAAVAVAVPLDRLNADPLMVNCQSGTIRFRQAVDEYAAAFPTDQPPAETWGFEVVPHAREHLISKMVDATHDPAATAPAFDAFLSRIQPDPETRAFLQRWFGYSLTGLTTEQKLLFAHGGGRNGKSTLVDTIAAILADYATTVPIESLTGAEQRKGSDATPDLVRIPGARMVRASEPEQGQRMKEALVKALTGGEPVLIRRMQQEFVEVTPEFKLTISGNHKPEIRGDDDGIWRRVMLVPFEEQIAAEEVDPLLPAKLRAEAAGILNWMIQGAVAWLENGLQVPASINAATRVYREESDPLRVFLLTECDVTGRDTDELLARDVVDAFRLWMENRGDEPWGKRAVSNRLAKAAGMFKHPETGATFAAKKKSDAFYAGLAFKPEIAVRLGERRERGDGWRG